MFYYIDILYIKLRIGILILKIVAVPRYPHTTIHNISVNFRGRSLVIVVTKYHLYATGLVIVVTKYRTAPLQDIALFYP